MTGTASSLAALVQERQIPQATDLEERTSAAAVGDTDDLLTEALAAAAALWVSAFGATTAAGSGLALARVLRQVGAGITQALAGLGERARRAVAKVLPSAVGLGVRHAREVARAAGRRVPARAGGRAKPGRDTVMEAARIGQRVEEISRRVEKLLAARPARFSGLAAVVQAARTAVSHVRAAVAWLVHRAVDVGGAAVAADLRLGRLWVAEVDACVRCSAYSGQYAAPGEGFEGGRSFDPAQRGRGPDEVTGPPLHPHCRCRVVPWLISWPIPLPAWLEQRAANAVAEGRAPASESQAARVRAARTVLASRRRLRARAQAAARRAVREGRFPAAG
ncbi:hypothetical protein [Kitasatospora camelliae]|uniref:Minor capsid protein 2 n=1 Tax=Kitasatospora camelliae TaxID=3156397 RepID=A0AAU8K6Q2_9ACTN